MRLTECSNDWDNLPSGGRLSSQVMIRMRRKGLATVEGLDLTSFVNRASMFVESVFELRRRLVSPVHCKWQLLH